MKSANVYQEYSDTLQGLNRLQSEYDQLTLSDDIVEKREELLEQIKTCTRKLLSVTDQLIYSNPFQNGMRVKHGQLKESLV